MVTDTYENNTEQDDHAGHNGQHIVCAVLFRIPSDLLRTSNNKDRPASTYKIRNKYA